MRWVDILESHDDGNDMDLGGGQGILAKDTGKREMSSNVLVVLCQETQKSLSLLWSVCWVW